MASRFLNRFGFAFWLGLLALTVSGVAQTQLSLNVVEASLTDSHGAHGHSHDHGVAAHEAAAGGHYMPDGTYMAGPMPGMSDAHDHTEATHAADPARSGGHTHKGHADCIMCSLVATMASLTQPAPVAVVTPETLPAPILLISEQEIVRTTPRGPYASRAPPSQQA